MELKIEKSTAKKLYPESLDWFKEVLTESFGKECFKKRNFDEIRTFEDACEELGVKPCDVYCESDTPDEVAYKKLKVIVRAINNGWFPDWNNENQRKWYPRFNLSSNLNFSKFYCDCTHMTAIISSHLCFESEEKSDYAARQFIDLYKEFLTIKK